MRLLRIILLLAIVLTGCKRTVTDTSGPARQTPTSLPELPYILEGDYTPDTGVLYKVIVDGDTCFVTIDSMDDESMHGFYYQTVENSDCVERKPFSQDIHWKNRRREATVYRYSEPAFQRANDSLFRVPCLAVNVQRGVEYGQALGYWCSLPNSGSDSYLDILSEGLKNGIVRTTQSLRMDIYSPNSDSTQRRPLLLLLHGGGFYAGDKQDSAISGWCRHFASMGYVAVSANYRLGFLPTKNEIARTGYMALQDAHAAMRYLVEHADSYGIDTALLFIGGASAGSITALNVAFMRDKDRPKAVYENRLRDLGPIGASGNSSHATFHIKAVANLWGALTNLNMLKNSHTDIVSFHGDADQVVPYDNGYPFNDISSRLGKRMFDRMYGSLQIDKRARELGLRSVLYPFKGQGHSLHHFSDGSWNQKNFESIRDKMTDFFYEEIAGKQPVITADRDDPRHFSVEGDILSGTAWHVEGGFIMRMEESDIWVVWRDEAPRHRLTASGRNAKGLGFNITRNVEQQKD